MKHAVVRNALDVDRPLVRVVVSVHGSRNEARTRLHKKMGEMKYLSVMQVDDRVKPGDEVDVS